MKPVRPAAVAGTWYPGTPAALASAVDRYLAATAYGVAQDSVDRPDEIRPSLPIADVLANAPDREQAPRDGGFFKVPRVIG